MIKFFDHIGRRQSSHGINDAFRFKAVLSSRKKGGLTKAVYKELQPTAGSTLFIPRPDIYHNNVMPESTFQGPGTETALENESHQAFNMEQMTSVFAVDNDTAPVHVQTPAGSTSFNPGRDIFRNNIMPSTTTQDTGTEPALSLTEDTQSLRPLPRPKQKKKGGNQGPAQAVIETEPAPALTKISQSLRPRPRPKPKKNGRNQGPAQAVIVSEQPAPALTEITGSVRPRPRPIQKKKAGEQTCIETQSGIVVPDEHPQLVLDPEHQWEPQIDLDPSLDPSFSPCDLPAEPSSESQSTSFMPEPAKTPRRKSKAVLLAIEEAMNYMATGKRRR